MKDLVLPLLKKEVEKKGVITESALKEISKKTGIPISHVYGAATFYYFIQTEKQGKNVIHVCTSPSCTVNGSLNIIKILEKELKIKLGKSNKKFSLYETSCIGCCDEAPAMLLNGKPETNLTKERILKILKKCKS